MESDLGALAIVILIGLVLSRTLILKRRGIQVMNFGKLDRSDFLIPPFALFYFYLIFAAALHLPSVSTQEFFHSDVISSVGVAFCLTGIVLVGWSIVSLGQSFRVGIDTDHPDKLITTGIYAVSRNPIYLAFALVLLGQFLIFPNWILLVYLAAAGWLFHRQVLREEAELKKQYGRGYAEYCERVRRYF